MLLFRQEGWYELTSPRTLMRRTLVLILLTLLLQACGTRGPLYLPPPDAGDRAHSQKKGR
jgi:predicted small lipoprotein YifL